MNPLITQHHWPIEKMADCTPEEQIVKINEREIRKKQIENNKQFEEIVNMVRETDYINTKKDSFNRRNGGIFDIAL